MATLGKTSDGASNISSSGERKYASRFTATEDGTITSIHFRVSVSADTALAKGVVYSDTASAPDALLVTGAEVSITETSPTWKQSNASLAITNGTSYWFGVHHNDPGTANILVHCDGTSSQTQRNSDTYGGGASNPFGTPTADIGPIDVYVTYTPAGAGGGVPVKVHHYRMMGVQ